MGARALLTRAYPQPRLSYCSPIEPTTTMDKLPIDNTTTMDRLSCEDYLLLASLEYSSQQDVIHS